MLSLVLVQRSLFSFLVGTEVGTLFNSLKVKLLAGDLKTAQSR